jgi:hypothetical protein
VLLAVVFGYWFLWAPPRVTVDAEALEFGEQRVGTESAPQTLRLGNRGRRPLRVATVALAGAGAGEFALLAESCAGRALPRGATCSMSVVFAPASHVSRSLAPAPRPDSPSSPSTSTSAARPWGRRVLRGS